MESSNNDQDVTSLLTAMGYDSQDIKAAIHFVPNSLHYDDYLNNVMDEIEIQQQITSLPHKPIIKITSIKPTSVSFTYCDNENNTYSSILECKIQHTKYDEIDFSKYDNDKIGNIENITKWSTKSIPFTQRLSNQNQQTLSELEGLNKYIFRFCVKNKIGWSEWSELQIIETQQEPLNVILLNPKEYTGKKREKETETNTDSKTVPVDAFNIAALKIGDKCDVEDNWRVWYEGEVIDIDDGKGLHISFLNWSEKFNEWLGFTEYERFSDLNTKTLKFENVNCAPMIVSKPQHYISKIDGKDYMIMICNDTGIIRYDVIMDKYEVLCADDMFNGVQVSFICTSMDTKKNIFYIICGVHDIKSFDVDNKKWINEDVEDGKEETEEVNFEYIDAVYIPNMKNCHYIVDINEERQLHYKYDGDKKCNKLAVNVEDGEYNPSNLSRYMMQSAMRLKNSRIFYCEPLNRVIINKEYYDETQRQFHHQWGYIQLDNDCDTISCPPLEMKARKSIGSISDHNKSLKPEQIDPMYMVPTDSLFQCTENNDDEIEDEIDDDTETVLKMKENKFLQQEVSNYKMPAIENENVNDNDNVYNYKWRNIEIDMKINSDKSYILGFAHLLFIFDLRYPFCIYCWDMITNKYYECDKRLPKTKRNPDGKMSKWHYGVICNNYAHFFDVVRNVHIKLDLYDLIPKQLFEDKFYSNNNTELLIAGYLREMDEFEYVMPLEVLKIIINAYPVFL